MADLAELMQPVAGDTLAGPDLSYDPRREEIEGAFETARRAERKDKDDPVAPPDWSAVIARVEELAALSKDAWLAVYLARAGAWSQQLETVVLGCTLLAEMFENWWDEIHPLLDEYGFQGRKAPCESLVSVGDFLRPLRRVVLVRHPRLGEFTGEQIESFARDESAENIGMFKAAIAETDEADVLAAADRLLELRSAINRVDAVLTMRADGDTGTNFGPTYEAIDGIRGALLKATGTNSAADEPVADKSSGEQSARSEPSSGPLFKVESRSDVVRAMESIISYYSRHEPGSPIPLVLTRAKGWVDMDFLSILNDINPGGADEAKRVLSRTPAGED